MIIFIHHQPVEHIKGKNNYVLSKVDTNVDLNFYVRRLTVSVGSSKLKYSSHRLTVSMLVALNNFINKFHCYLIGELQLKIKNRSMIKSSDTNPIFERKGFKTIQ